MPAGVSANRSPRATAVEGPFSRIERAIASRVRKSSPAGGALIIWLFTTVMYRKSRVSSHSRGVRGASGLAETACHKVGLMPILYLLAGICRLALVHHRRRRSHHWLGLGLSDLARMHAQALMFRLPDKLKALSMPGLNSEIDLLTFCAFLCR